MRFLLVCPAFPPAAGYGGTTLSALGLARGLRQQGHEVLVLTTDADGAANLSVPVGRITSFEGVPVLYHHRWGQNAYFWCRGLARSLQTLAPEFDVALVRGNWGYINLAAARFLYPRVPLVIYPEGSFDPWAFRHRGWKKVIYWRLIEKLNYRRAAAVIALTRKEAEQLKGMKIKAPVEVIPNGIFPEEFDREVAIRGAAARYLGQATRPMLLYLGRLHPKKGIDTLIAAMGLIPAPSRPLLLIAGAGEQGYELTLKNMVEELRLSEDIFFTGPVAGDEKLSLLKASSILVLASRGEGLPLAVLEGMAAGKPVVITPGCNLPEVEEWQAGVVVEGKAGTIAGAVQGLLRDETRRRCMGENARALVNSRFTWSAVAQKTAAFAEKILARQG